MGWFQPYEQSTKLSVIKNRMNLRIADFRKTWRKEIARQLSETPPDGEEHASSGSMRLASQSAPFSHSCILDGRHQSFL